MLTSNPSLRNKSLRARNKIPHVELLRGDARLVPRYAMTATYGNRKRSIQKKIFCLSEKKSSTKELFYNDFRKVIIYNSIPDALHDLHASKYKRPHNRPYDACLWKSAKRNKARTSKQPRFIASPEPFN